ncbi:MULTISPECIES: tyrosine-type recombinase/integrase [Lactobacillus]|uniref:Site-specific integrase n=1 Tax=Lactobacillus xujianguonis TaxID=2495899 RepID=A0A437SU35_9LACO|nr:MULTISPECIES: tyrosine-type recombinase/integrase [Lactobacillus]RVU70394.1 site-specific integrase [Lactobacillus xujianguonis]RVU73641.1 site-specific integrase [Lactobacillus xujianguonis]
MREVVRPITDTWTLRSVQDELKKNQLTGMRDYTLFQVGKATLLRISDVLNLKKGDVYTDSGEIKKNAYIIDKKTKKRNVLFLEPVERELAEYFKWLQEMQNKIYQIDIHDSNTPLYLRKYGNPNNGFNGHVFSSPWLFPSFTHAEKPIGRKQYWQIMKKVGVNLHLDYLGTHTMRKTGAYRVYEQTNHNIALVMQLLNHSSEQMTLRYLGLDQEARERTLKGIDFG